EGGGGRVGWVWVGGGGGGGGGAARRGLPRAVFRTEGFTAANGVSFFMYAGLFGTLFLMTQFLQSAQHYTPLQAGIRMLPWTAAAMVVSPVAGKLADRYGNRPFITAGLLLQAAGLAWIAAAAAPC